MLMRLFVWTPTFKPEEETPIAPVWVILPQFPWHCYCMEIITPLLEDVGKALFLDAATFQKTRGSVAKVKIEMDITRERPNHIWMGYDEDEFGEGRWQEVQYENVPPYCTYCKHQGHGIHSCTVRMRDEEFQRKKLQKETNAAGCKEIDNEKARKPMTSMNAQQREPQTKNNRVPKPTEQEQNQTQQKERFAEARDKPPTTKQAYVPRKATVKAHASQEGPLKEPDNCATIHAEENFQVPVQLPIAEKKIAPLTDCIQLPFADLDAGIFFGIHQKSVELPCINAFDVSNDWERHDALNASKTVYDLQSYKPKDCAGATFKSGQKSDHHVTAPVNVQKTPGVMHGINELVVVNTGKLGAALVDHLSTNEKELHGMTQVGAASGGHTIPLFHQATGETVGGVETHNVQQPRLAADSVSSQLPGNVKNGAKDNTVHQMESTPAAESTKEWVLKAFQPVNVCTVQPSFLSTGNVQCHRNTVTATALSTAVMNNTPPCVTDIGMHCASTRFAYHDISQLPRALGVDKLQNEHATLTQFYNDDVNCTLTGCLHDTEIEQEGIYSVMSPGAIVPQTENNNIIKPGENPKYTMQVKDVDVRHAEVQASSPPPATAIGRTKKKKKARKPAGTATQELTTVMETAGEIIQEAQTEEEVRKAKIRAWQDAILAKSSAEIPVIESNKEPLNVQENKAAESIPSQESFDPAYAITMGSDSDDTEKGKALAEYVSPAHSGNKLTPTAKLEFMCKETSKRMREIGRGFYPLPPHSEFVEEEPHDPDYYLENLFDDSHNDQTTPSKDGKTKWNLNAPVFIPNALRQQAPHHEFPTGPSDEVLLQRLDLHDIRGLLHRQNSPPHDLPQKFSSPHPGIIEDGSEYEDEDEDSTAYNKMAEARYAGLSPRFEQACNPKLIKKKRWPLEPKKKEAAPKKPKRVQPTRSSKSRSTRRK